MGIFAFVLGALTLLLLYWMFVKEKSHKHVLSLVFAVVFIALTLFTVDFVGTTLIEGAVQAAVVAFVLFGIFDVAFFILWRRFLPGSKAKLQNQSVAKEG